MVVFDYCLYSGTPDSGTFWESSIFPLNRGFPLLGFSAIGGSTVIYFYQWGFLYFHVFLCCTKDWNATTERHFTQRQGFPTHTGHTKFRANRTAQSLITLPIQSFAHRAIIQELRSSCIYSSRPFNGQTKILSKIAILLNRQNCLFSTIGGSQKTKITLNRDKFT